MTRLLAAYPISGEDLSALPVRTLDAAIAFYERVLGFAVVNRETASATVCRDGVNLGLVVQVGHDPARAGSVAIEVDDLESLHEEIAAAGGQAGEFGDDKWGGRMHRTFFVREQENGYCYCFFRPL